MADQPLVNKVAQSGLITLDLSRILPDQPVFSVVDISDFLFRGLVLREKEFRQALKETDWSTYEGQWVGITCSTDAIVPHWAFMLLTTYLQPFAERVIHGDRQTLVTQWTEEALSDFGVDRYQDERIIIKGCGDKEVPVVAYSILTRKLMPVAKSVMYGEPCSTVPVFKKKR